MPPIIFKTQGVSPVWKGFYLKASVGPVGPAPPPPPPPSTPGVPWVVYQASYEGIGSLASHDVTTHDKLYISVQDPGGFGSIIALDMISGSSISWNTSGSNFESFSTGDKALSWNGGTLYAVGTASGGVQSAIAAILTADGTIPWTVCCSGTLAGVSLDYPTTGNAQIYAVDDGGDILAFTGSGALVWSHDGYSVDNISGEFLALYNVPTILEDHNVAAIGDLFGDVTAIKKLKYTNGSEIWCAPTSGTSHLYGQIVADHSGNIYAIPGDTGQLESYSSGGVFRWATGSGTAYFDTTPAIGKLGTGHVYILGGLSGGSSGCIVCRSIEDGGVVWACNHRISYPHGQSPAVSPNGDMVYIHLGGRHDGPAELSGEWLLTAVWASSGVVAWDTKVSGLLQKASVCLDKDGYIYAIQEYSRNDMTQSLAKLNGSGNIIWANANITLGTATTWSQSLVVDGDSAL